MSLHFAARPRRRGLAASACGLLLALLPLSLSSALAGQAAGRPLYGVDTSGDKQRAFARRLAAELALPRDSFSCSGRCHGTLTQWFNRHFAGANITVEFGPDPPARYLSVRAPNGLLRAIGGAR